jgi:FkbM family methyltransferase
MQSVREKLHLEIPVTLALVDLLRPGEIAFDVGANVADLAIIMSRLVGPRGSVVALEANARTAERALENLRTYHCANTFLINRAAAARSNQTMDLYLGDGPNDSLIKWPWLSTETLPVTTVALDDLIEHLQMTPRVIKMDVEGFELEVLKGAIRYISSHLPVMILEQNDGDDGCIRFLTDLGYHIYCLASYRRIRSTSDYFRPGKGVVRNVVAYHPQSECHRGSALEGLHAVELKEVASLTKEDFNPEGPWVRSRPYRVPAGRYSLQMSYTPGDAEQIEVGLATKEDRFVASYTGPSSWLQHLFELPLHLDEPAELRVALHCHDGLAAAERLVPSEFRLIAVHGVPEFRPGLVYCL